jgi:hypothetical protein
MEIPDSAISVMVVRCQDQPIHCSVDVVMRVRIVFKHMKSNKLIGSFEGFDFLFPNMESCWVWSDRLYVRYWPLNRDLCS